MQISLLESQIERTLKHMITETHELTKQDQREGKNAKHLKQSRARKQSIQWQ